MTRGGVPEPASDEARVIARAMFEALVKLQTDVAERLYGELCDAEPRARDMHIYPTIIAIQRGQLLDVYRDLADKGEDHCPELQALCLHRMGDPTWEGLAQKVEADSSAAPHVRHAMRLLLGMSEPVA